MRHVIANDSQINNLVLLQCRTVFHETEKNLAYFCCCITIMRYSGTAVEVTNTLASTDATQHDASIVVKPSSACTEVVTRPISTPALHVLSLRSPVVKKNLEQAWHHVLPLHSVTLSPAVFALSTHAARTATCCICGCLSNQYSQTNTDQVADVQRELCR